MRIDVIDHPDAPVPALPAATVVLVRDGAAELEVLMIHRGADTAFGGMWAFPGGVIEPADVPTGSEPDPLPAARAAAARETREELGLHVDPSDLVYWSHWLPPIDSLSRKRFSTWFFLAPAGDEHAAPQVRVDGEEVHAARWLPPAVALGLQERGDVLLAPPTYVTLTQLARYGDVGSALAAAAPVRFATQVVFDGGVRCCLWEGDVGYGDGDRLAAGPRHRLIMDETNGWRYVNNVGAG